MLTRSLCLSVVFTTLLGCATPSRDRSIAELDRAVGMVRDKTTSLQRVDLGRTIDVDHLIAYYDGSTLVMAEAIYQGYTTTRDTFYVVSANGPEVVVADETTTTGSSGNTIRYYIVDGAVVASRRHDGQPVAAERSDIVDMYRIVRTTAANAAAGDVVSITPTGE